MGVRAPPLAPKKLTPCPCNVWLFRQDWGYLPHGPVVRSAEDGSGRRVLSRTRIVCLFGPTGTGKTEAALALAEALDGAIINVDSRQVYAGLAVLTAQPTPDEQARCPHVLQLDPSEDGTFAHQPGR